ncbi:DNA polymerase [Actinomyces minihominis]|uniref:DNA polymerase n=1 Tax=Actinomyces minihominis TaxID=2002838 RepID=UPI000C07DA86|nr:DNA polymerase [Actinomyces minihominis]
METIAIDLETRSSVNLTKSGLHKYAESPDFEILLFAYSTDCGPVRVIDLAGGEILPPDILAALIDPNITKTAFNAAFERICLSSWLRRHHPDTLSGHGFLDPAQWRCTMVWSAYLGLPMSLESVARVLSLPVQKDTAGKKLIKQFCLPQAPTVLNEGTKFNPPTSDPQAWQQFKNYNHRDVEVEIAIQDRLASFPMPEVEWEAYALDQRINDRGVALDQTLVDNAVRCATGHHDKSMARAQDLTGLENPNSPLQLKEWLISQGCDIGGLTRQEVSRALELSVGDVREVLRLRSDMSRSSTKKYQAMQMVAGDDSRARGLIQFYGAGRTGRFAGRLIQVQNLPRNYLPDLESARGLVRVGHFDALELLYPSVPDTLSQLVRTAFVPAPGHRFIVADFSAIEARVIAWLAGEDWRLDLFQAGGDIYCQSASQMFGVPVGKHGPNPELRQKGKISELACGYNGSVGALKAMGALEMGLKEEELKPLVDAWRASNPNIVGLWADVEEAAIQAITTHSSITLHNLTFAVRSGILFITLPSGRQLAYVQPSLGENRWGGTSINYWGVGAGKKWQKLETYGGKLVENIVQAIARDLLTHALKLLDDAGHKIVMHVHDEAVIEEPLTSCVTVERICHLMATPPAWADGLPLDADGYECGFYKKD